MKWNESLAIKHGSIDDQHKKIFEAIDSFIEACNQRKGNEEVTKTINFLQKYTVEHFRDEERVMQSKGYPKLAEHKKVHEAFTKMVNDVVADVKAKGVGLQTVMTVNMKINGGLVNHILHVDKAFGEWLKSQ